MLHFNFGKSFYDLFGHGHMLCKVSYCSWLWRQILYKSNIALIFEGKQRSAFGLLWILLPKHFMSSQTIYRVFFDRIIKRLREGWILQFQPSYTLKFTAFWERKLFWRWWKFLSLSFLQVTTVHRPCTNCQFFHNMTSPSFSARLWVWLYSKSIIIHVTMSSIV